MEELQNEMLLSQSIIKRREWTKKYRVADSVLYDLFSEFSSMVVLAKSWKQSEEKAAKSYKSKARFKLNKNVKKPTAASAAIDKKMKGLLPIESDTKMSLKMQELMQAEDTKFETDSLNDFKVPLFMFR